MCTQPHTINTVNCDSPSSAAVLLEDSPPNFLQEDKHLASVSYLQPSGGIFEQHVVPAAAAAAAAN